MSLEFHYAVIVILVYTACREAATTGKLLNTCHTSTPPDSEPTGRPPATGNYLKVGLEVLWRSIVMTICDCTDRCGREFVHIVSILVLPDLGVISVAPIDVLISRQSPYQPSLGLRPRRLCSCLVEQYGSIKPTRRAVAPDLVVRPGSPRGGFPPPPTGSDTTQLETHSMQKSPQSRPLSGKTVVTHRHSHTLSLPPYI